MEADNGNAEIDITNQDGFIKYLQSLPPCPEQTIRLFNRNDFYTAHGENALFLARSFLNTLTSVKMIGTATNKVESVVISSTRFEPLLHHLLIEHNMCIEIYNTRGNGWALTTNASPTNLGTLEDLVHGCNHTTVLNQVILALTIENDLVYFICLDVLKCNITVGRFKDDRNFAHFETLLIQLNPRECFLVNNQACNARLENILSRNKILVKKYDSDNVDVGQMEKLLDDFLKPEAKKMKEQFLTNHRLAFNPLGELIDYLCLEDDPFGHSSYSLSELVIDSYVHLDLSSLTNLHLFASPDEMRGKGVRSLYQLLNHCQTMSGKALLDQFIRRPELNLETIEQRLNIVEYFINNWPTVSSQICENILYKIPDITKIYKKFINGRCSLKELYQMYMAVEQLPLLIEIFAHLNKKDPLENCVHKVIFVRLETLSSSLLKLKDLVYDSIDFDHYNQTKELWVRASFSEDLQELKQELDSIDEEASKQINKVSRSLEANLDLPSGNVKLELDKNGYYFRVNKINIANILKDESYKEVSGNSKDGRFVNDKLANINSRYLALASKYDKLQQTCVKQLIETARTFLDDFMQFESIIALIDTLLALAKAAQSASTQYVRPMILPKGSGKIMLRQFRHPIIEIIKQSAYVPNDICLDRDAHKFYVITGINMGGKSSIIRSVALNVLMAQIGSFVPADQAEISIVDAIFSRLNASDDPNSGLSTFFAEMIETSAILKTATENSLVIIDELGRSTGSSDGFGLASSIVNRLANQVNVFGLFATHFHDLAEHNQHVGKLYMKSEIIDGEIVTHYQALPGTSNNSFGIEIARTLNICPKIIENAEKRLKSNDDNCKQRINNLVHSIKTNIQREGITKDAIKKYLQTINLNDIPDSDNSGGIDYVKALYTKTLNNSSIDLFED